jgi:hypothetical protein
MPSEICLCFFILKLEQENVEDYRAITVYELSQLRCLAVVCLRKEFDKGRLGYIR